ncbi:MAG: putative metal-dependent hydrolase [Gemmatimonadota bacterium]|nr:MAG: putative metal-dependent hydrolase [Gemmatimonadota bacterium]
MTCSESETALKYPIGRFTVEHLEKQTDPATRQLRIESLAKTPSLFECAVAGLTEEQQNVPYRPGGWSIRQVVHHMADSHLQAYAVFKMTLTTDKPLLRMYDCAAWGEFVDARTGPVAASLSLLSGVHARWDLLLHSMDVEGFSRSFERPEWGGLITLDNFLQMLDWHHRHHLAQVTNVRHKQGR